MPSKIGRVNSDNFPDMPYWMKAIYDARLLKGAMRNITHLGFLNDNTGVVRLMYFWDIVEVEPELWRVTMPNATKPAYYYSLNAAKSRLSRNAKSFSSNPGNTWSGERWLAKMKITRDVRHAEDISFKMSQVQALQIVAMEYEINSWQRAAKIIIENFLSDEGYYDKVNDRGHQFFKEIPK